LSGEDENHAAGAGVIVKAGRKRETWRLSGEDENHAAGRTALNILSSKIETFY